MIAIFTGVYLASRSKPMANPFSDNTQTYNRARLAGPAPLPWGSFAHEATLTA